MSAYLQWGTGDGQQLTFDITTQENHKGSLKITDHPVEKGGNVADNARQDLDQVTLEVFVSNTPLDPNPNTSRGSVYGMDLPNLDKDPVFSAPVFVQQKIWERPLPGVGFETELPLRVDVGPDQPVKRSMVATVLQFDSPVDVVATVLEQLRTLQATYQLLTVVTSERSYDNMMLETFDLSRNAESGTGGVITLELRQIRIVDTKTVTAPVATEARGTGSVNQGAKGSTPVKGGANTKKSWLKLILGE